MLFNNSRLETSIGIEEDDDELVVAVVLTLAFAPPLPLVVEFTEVEFCCILTAEVGEFIFFL